MVNVYIEGKKDVANALNSITGAKVTASYSVAITQLPSVLYAELINTNANKGDEVRTDLAYSVDIYSNVSTTELAAQIDDVMTMLGFKRGACVDLDDPNGIRHKNMKYTGVYDALTNMYYQE